VDAGAVAVALAAERTSSRLGPAACTKIERLALRAKLAAVAVAMALVFLYPLITILRVLKYKLASLNGEERVRHRKLYSLTSGYP
jgi:hypothetical protein